MTQRTTKWIYVIGWSISLLAASFPCILKGKLLPLVENSIESTMDHYIYPTIMALAVFLVDIIYSSVKEERAGKPLQVANSWILILVFLLAFCFSLFFNNSLVQVFLFIILWISLTLLKFIKTDAVSDGSYLGCKVDE